MTTRDDRPSTIVLNGFWAKVAQGILVASILAGSSGLVVALRMAWAQDGHTSELADHEQRLRVMESQLGRVQTGIEMILERLPRQQHGPS